MANPALGQTDPSAQVPETVPAEEAPAAGDQPASATAETVVKASPGAGGLPGFTLSGFVQTDYAAKQISEDQLNTSTGAPLNEDRFLLRRARLRATNSASPIP